MTVCKAFCKFWDGRLGRSIVCKNFKSVFTGVNVPENKMLPFYDDEQSSVISPSSGRRLRTWGNCATLGAWY